MDERFALAGKGLWLLFLSAMLPLAAGVVAIVPIIGWVAAPFMCLAGLGLQFYAPYTARKSHPNFENAFYIALGSLLLGIISIPMPKEGVLAGAVDLIAVVLEFLITFLICTGAGELLREKGEHTLADHADLLWKIAAGCALVSILCTLVGWVPVLGAIVGAAGVAASVVAMVAYVLKAFFYYQAAHSLRVG